MMCMLVFSDEACNCTPIGSSVVPPAQVWVLALLVLLSTRQDSSPVVSEAVL